MCVSEENCNNNNKETEMLKKYEIIYTAYADEIRNLWQRSIFLGAFMTLAWGGYGSLQLKFIEKVEKLPLNATNGNGFNIEMYYNCASLGLCFVLIVLSLLWIAMAKGSKFVQEAHEKHIEDFNFCENDTKKLFCKLESYEYKTYQDNYSDKDKKEINKDLKPNLFFGGALKAYRYSPSKINIALGVFSAIVAVILGIIHTIMSKNCYVVILAVAMILLMIFFRYYLMEYLKGGETRTKGAKNG